MITQLQWIIISGVVIYLIVGAWTYGYVYAQRGYDEFDSGLRAIFFPIYLLCAWILSPIAEIGNQFATKRLEKKARIEAHEKEAAEQIAAAEQELNEELSSKAA